MDKNKQIIANPQNDLHIENSKNDTSAHAEGGVKTQEQLIADSLAAKYGMRRNQFSQKYEDERQADSKSSTRSLFASLLAAQSFSWVKETSVKFLTQKSHEITEAIKHVDGEITGLETKNSEIDQALAETETQIAELSNSEQELDQKLNDATAQLESIDVEIIEAEEQLIEIESDPNALIADEESLRLQNLSPSVANDENKIYVAENVAAQELSATAALSNPENISILDTKTGELVALTELPSSEQAKHLTDISNQNTALFHKDKVHCPQNERYQNLQDKVEGLREDRAELSVYIDGMKVDLDAIRTDLKDLKKELRQLGNEKEINLDKINELKAERDALVNKRESINTLADEIKSGKITNSDEISARMTQLGYGNEFAVFSAEKLKAENKLTSQLDNNNNAPNPAEAVITEQPKGLKGLFTSVKSNLMQTVEKVTDSIKTVFKDGTDANDVKADDTPLTKSFNAITGTSSFDKVVSGFTKLFQKPITDISLTDEFTRKAGQTPLNNILDKMAINNPVLNKIMQLDNNLDKNQPTINMMNLGG
jgi:chromosome segregation ATPase